DWSPGLDGPLREEGDRPLAWRILHARICRTDNGRRVPDLKGRCRDPNYGEIPSVELATPLVRRSSISARAASRSRCMARTSDPKFRMALKVPSAGGENELLTVSSRS